MKKTTQKPFYMVPDGSPEDGKNNDLFFTFYTSIRPIGESVRDSRLVSAAEQAMAASDFMETQYAEHGKENGRIFQSLAELRRVLANQGSGLKEHVGNLQMAPGGLICFNGDPRETIARRVLVK
jgi:hypothetical protein